MYKYTTKLSLDNYNRPPMTYTEKLTPEQIEEKLQDYQKVEDLYAVPIGTHLRYFIIKDGLKLFRTGGLLHKNQGLPVYIILTNGINSWSVQVKNTIFYRKMTQKEIRDDHDDALQEQDKEIKTLQENNEKLMKEMKKINSMYTKIMDENTSLQMQLNEAKEDNERLVRENRRNMKKNDILLDKLKQLLKEKKSKRMRV